MHSLYPYAYTYVEKYNYVVRIIVVRTLRLVEGINYRPTYSPASADVSTSVKYRNK